MTSEMDRREFMRLAGIGGVVFLSGLHAQPGLALGKTKDFFFVQLSDSHWGFEGAKINPDAKGTLIKTVKRQQPFTKA